MALLVPLPCTHAMQNPRRGPEACLPPPLFERGALELPDQGLSRALNHFTIVFDGRVPV